MTEMIPVEEKRTMMVKDDTTLVAFVNSEQPPIKTRHICYYATDAGNGEINLCEVFEATYPHPEAPQDAVIPVIDYRVVKTVRRQQYQAAHIVLMEAQQKACRTIEVRG